MTATEKLYFLIANLQKAEKKFFVQWAEKQEGGNQYLKLYKIMEPAIAYSPDKVPLFTLNDDQIVKRLVRQHVREGNYFVVRNHLTENLLKALRLMKEEQQVEDVIRRNIRDANLLTERGLFAWAAECLEDALEKARSYQYHHHAIEALRQLIYLRSQEDALRYADMVRAYIEELDQISRIQYIENQYYSINFQTLLLYRIHRGKAFSVYAKDYEDLVSMSLMTETAERPTFLSEIYYWNARTLLHDLIHGSAESLEYSRKGIELWMDPGVAHIREQRQLLYFRQLSNYISYCIVNGRFEEFDRLISEFEHCNPNHFDEIAEAWQSKIFLQQLYFLNKKEPEKLLAIVPSIEKELEKYAVKINKSRLLTIRYHIILAGFIVEDFHRVKKHCEIFLNYRKTEIRRDLQVIVQLLQIISAFELQHPEDLEKIYRKNKPILTLENKDTDFQRVALVQLVTLCEISLDNALSPYKRLKAKERTFKTFEMQLEQLESAHLRPLPTGFLEVKAWVLSKTLQKPVRNSF